MRRRDSLLVCVLTLVDRVPLPSARPQRGQGRPRVSSDRLVLKALVIMLVRPLHRVPELLSVLDEPTAEMHLVRTLLTAAGRCPTRRTWERRLHALPPTLPAHIGWVGRCVGALLDPWAPSGRALASDRTVLRAHAGVWHTKPRDPGVVPHPSLDPEAHWTTSGWQGWGSGWPLHLVTVVAAVWIPGAAELTAAKYADPEIALRLVPERPPATPVGLGDSAYADPTRPQPCAAAGRLLITPCRGPYPHADDGVAVRRLFHQRRALALEHFHEQGKGMFAGHGHVPTKGLSTPRRFALGALLVYPLVLG